jgi:hypothetical protein
VSNWHLSHGAEFWSEVVPQKDTLMDLYRCPTFRILAGWEFTTH